MAQQKIEAKPNALSREGEETGDSGGSGSSCGTAWLGEIGELQNGHDTASEDTSRLQLGQFIGRYLFSGQMVTGEL
jgi:hypothetical protein